MGRVTLQTIADVVGVSRTTVSNAFSRPDQLSDDLRDRILAAAAEVGYGGPDPLARGLRSGTVGSLGVLLTESLAYAFADPYATTFLQGVAEVTGAADIGMLLLPLPPQRPVGNALRNAVVDGFVVYSMPDGHPALDVLRTRGLPLVTVDGPRLAGVAYVAIDNRGAARQIAEEVFSRGHERVLVLTFRVADDERTGPVDDDRIARATYHVTVQRLRGILDASRAAGRPREDVMIEEVGLNTRLAAEHATLRHLQGPHAPTAVIAVSDVLALGALDAAATLGLEVPGDLTVTGYDDLPAAEQLGLTTVRQSALAKGRRAAEVLLSDETSGDVVLPHELVRRSSVGDPPRS